MSARLGQVTKSSSRIFCSPFSHALFSRMQKFRPTWETLMIDTMLEAIKVADPNKQRRQKNGDKGSGFGLCTQLVNFWKINYLLCAAWVLVEMKTINASPTPLCLTISDVIFAVALGLESKVTDRMMAEVSAVKSVKPFPLATHMPRNVAALSKQRACYPPVGWCRHGEIEGGFCGLLSGDPQWHGKHMRRSSEHTIAEATRYTIGESEPPNGKPICFTSAQGAAARRLHCLPHVSNSGPQEQSSNGYPAIAKYRWNGRQNAESAARTISRTSHTGVLSWIWLRKM